MEKKVLAYTTARMTVRQKLWISFAGIIVLAGLAGLVDYPNGPDISWQGKIVRELKVQLGLDLQGGTSLTYEADLANVEVGQETEALAGVRDVIERRINAFGVSEPVIQTSRSGQNWRVIVELPGITDVNEAIQRIGETPILEFKTEGEPQPLTAEQTQFIQSLNEQSKTSAQGLLDRAKAGEDFSALAQEGSQDEGSATAGGELGYFPREQMDAAFAEAAFGGEVGTVLPDLVLSQFGYHIIKVEDHTTGKLAVLNGTKTAEEAVDDPEVEAVKASHILIKTIPEDPAIFGPNYVDTGLTGQQLEKAAVEFDQTTNTPLVSLKFDSEGTKLFADITTQNIGKTVAILLDGTAISTPSVDEPITTGEAVIQGDFNLEEAKDLARSLNQGALPVPIELVEQRTIGPSLGVEALEHSVLAGVIAMVCLAIFMIGYYRYPGVIAMVALSLYGLVLLAIFKIWPITLTLSGIAGFLLSLGMAVDANVLIFERLREELRRGKPLQTAMDDGFKRAWLSIRDSNVSSLITCGILTWFGTSLIKGFALTLAIGIVLSLFTAITVTRTLLKLFPLKNKWWYGV